MCDVGLRVKLQDGTGGMVIGHRGQDEAIVSRDDGETEIYHHSKIRIQRGTAPRPVVVMPGRRRAIPLSRNWPRTRTR